MATGNTNDTAIDLTTENDDGDNNTAKTTTTAVKRTRNDALADTKSKKTKTTTTNRSLISSIYIVCTCNYPLHNDKWGEHSGHETEDTEIVAVYANIKDANRRAKEERDWGDVIDEDDDDDDDDDSTTSLFYWQDEEPSEWTARRVWVEEKTIQY